MKRRCFIHLITMALAIALVACAAIPSLEFPVLPGETGDTPILDISCSETIPSSEIIQLTWKNISKFQDKHRLDLTVYESGFNQNRYASIWPLKRGQTAQKLKFSKLRERTVDPALLPQIASLTYKHQQDETKMKLQGLASGLIYEARLMTFKGKGWVPGPRFRIEVPTCITEPFEEHQRESK